jgi:hypothetical protein
MINEFVIKNLYITEYSYIKYVRNEKQQMKNDLIELKQQYCKAAQQIPADSFFKQSLDHKFRHSLEVLRQGQYILHHTPELADKDNVFGDLAQKALLFHDVGRFAEAALRCNAARNGTGLDSLVAAYNHGKIGYELLQNLPPYNDMRILFAIRWHGEMMQDILASAMYQNIKNSPQFDDIMLILKLVRDADKLANLQVIKQQDHLRQDLFYKQLAPEVINADISPKVKAVFLAKEVILSADLRSFADRILQIISWIYDLNYQTSKEVFKQQQYGSFLLDMLKKYHHDLKDIEEIATCLRQAF